MGDRSDPQTLQARDEAAAPIDEDLEEVLEDALDEAASPEEEGELEEGLGEEAEEPGTGETEAAIEAELESEDLTAINGEAVVEVLLRRSGVLPQETEIGTPDEEAQLPAPRQEDEFVCSRCFLIKPRTQLGNVEQRVCRDCLDPPQNGHEA
jgi:hypothetical protein